DEVDIVGLANLAGIVRRKPSIDLDSEDLDLMLGVHVHGSLFVAQAAARSMIRHGKGGSIVNTSSVAADFAWPARAPYGMAKAAVVSLTASLAVEWAEFGIRVNAISPGYVETPMAAAGVMNEQF